MSSSPSSSLRKRGGRKEAYSPLPSDDASSPLSSSKLSMAPKSQSGWDYRLALVVLTILAFITRFYKISYPNEVVFDEVHFGKVSEAVLIIYGLNNLTWYSILSVRFVLLTKNLFLRCPPSIWQIAFRFHGMADWL
jgi:hypothetical protein